MKRVLLVDAVSIESSTREISALRALGPHPNIVGFLGADQTLAMSCVAMERCSRTVLGVKMSTRKQRVAARQLFLALAHIHGMGYMHRDVSPSNVLLDACGDVKLADFGMSVRGTSSRNFQVVTSWYRAPEIYLELEYDARVDVWAAACVVYELAAHRPLFPLEEKEWMWTVYPVLGTPGPSWPEAYDEAEAYPFADVSALRFATAMRDEVLRRVVGMGVAYPPKRSTSAEVLEALGQ